MSVFYSMNIVPPSLLIDFDEGIICRADHVGKGEEGMIVIDHGRDSRRPSKYSRRFCIPATGLRQLLSAYEVKTLRELLGKKSALYLGAPNLYIAMGPLLRRKTNDTTRPMSYAISHS